MVSFFGLKLGGDKKKKSDKAAEPQAPQQSRKIDQNLLGEGQFFGTNVNKKGVVNGSIRSFSRPGTAYSNRTSTSKAVPYVHDTHNLAASSMFDLSNMNHFKRVPSFTSLKQSSSEANLRTNFGNGSSTSLGLPPTLGPSPGSSARPSTSHGQRAKPWVNPLDVHFNRSTPTGPKSPLGQYELQLNVDSDGSSLLGDKPENIADAISNQIDNDARAAKAQAQRSLSTPDIRAKGSRSPLVSSNSYPSPPESDTGDRAVFANSITPQDRSGSHQLAKANSSGGSSRSMPNGVNGPTALPSPPMSQPEDDEERPSWEGRPIIQNVAAKRDTLTVNPGRRQSLSMKIEELERTLVNQQKAHEGAARAAQEAQQQAGHPPQGERRPPQPFAERGPRPQSPSGMRPPMHHGEGPRPQSPMGRPPRPQSPAGMRGPMGGPRHQSPMGRHPRPQSPAGMRGPRPHSPAGYHGPRPHSPAGMRGPPRGAPPRGPPPRPHSPAGMRGPRPDSPNGMRGPMGRPPRPHSPAGHGPRNQSPTGRQRRPESPAGRHPIPGQWPQPPPSAQPPRPFSPAGHAMRSQSPMGRGPRPESPVIKHPIQVQSAPPPAETQAPPPRPHSPTGLQAPRSGSPLSHPPRAESPMDPDWRTMSPVSQTTINSPMSNSYSQGPSNRPPTRGRPPRPRPDEYGVPQSERRAPPPGPAKRPPRPKPEEAPPPRVAVPLIDPPKLSPPLRAPEPEREREISRPPNFARPRPPPLKATPRSLVPPTPTSADWPLPSPTAPQYHQQTGSNASPPPLSPTSPPPLSPPLHSPASFTHQPLSPPPRSPARPLRAKPPPLEFSAESYTTAVGPGPWTPPLRRPTINGSTDLDQRPVTAGKQGGGGSPSRTVAAEREQFFDKGFDFGLGPSSPVRRPNHGLQSPTGIADHFGTGFI